VRRHDNDHVSIRDINVAPTCEEALSSDPPFLPQNMPNAVHHLDGVERLLDVQFRLLREDFLRKLRHGVSQFWAGGQPGTVKNSRFTTSNGEVMFVFSSAEVVSFRTAIFGMSYGVEFDDLEQNRKASLESRRKFWERSRRLQHGCLICLCWKEPGQAAPVLIFATVSDRDPKMLARNASADPSVKGPTADQHARPQIMISTGCSGQEYNRRIFDRLIDSETPPTPGSCRHRTISSPTSRSLERSRRRTRCSSRSRPT
jgi:hypothetical protein